MSLKEEFLGRANGDQVRAATELARELMRGDESSFKAGYSAESAAVAAVELFALERSEAAQVALAVDADWEMIERVLAHSY